MNDDDLKLSCIIQDLKDNEITDFQLSCKKGKYEKILKILKKTKKKELKELFENQANKNKMSAIHFASKVSSITIFYFSRYKNPKKKNNNNNNSPEWK